MRSPLLVAVAMAALLVSTPGTARADLYGGNGIKLPTPPLPMFAWRPDLRAESVPFPAPRLSRGYVMPRVFVSNRGLANAGAFDVVVRVEWMRGGRRVSTTRRTRFARLRVGESRLHAVTALYIGAGRRATVTYVVDPVRYTGDSFGPISNRGEIIEMNEANNILQETLRAR